MNEYNTEAFKRASALAMASHLELNAKGFDKLGMIVERNECIRKVEAIRAKWAN